MRGYRFSIGGICAVVVVSAVAMAALRFPHSVWSGVLAFLFRSLVTLGIVGALCGRREMRAGLVGFAGFGLTIGLLGLVSYDVDMFSRIMGMLISRVTGEPYRLTPLTPPAAPSYGFSLAGVQTPDEIAFLRVSRVVFALIFATFGGVISQLLFGRKPTEKAMEPVVEDRPRQKGRRDSRLVLALAAYGAMAYLAILGSRSIPDYCVAFVAYSAWGVVLLMVVGAAFGRGRSRAGYMVAMLFGGAALWAISIHKPEQWEGWPEVATYQFLAVVRPWLPGASSEVPPSSDGVVAAHNRIRAVLNKPVTIDFPSEVPLEEFLKFVDDQFIKFDGKHLNIYVDPVGLQEVEKTRTSPVSISLQDVQLRRILDMTLKQVGLIWFLKDGMIVVESNGCNGGVVYESTDEARTPYYQIGHCFLAMCAAAIGAILGPRVYDRV